MIINDKEWRWDESGKSVAFFSIKKQNSVSKRMIEELKKISRERGKITSRFCMHNSPEENLQDMIVLAYRNKICKKPHKHVTSKEAIHLIEGRILALIFDENGEIVDKRILDENDEFAYRNDNGRYHLYFPLSEYIVMREIRDGKSVPGETVATELDVKKLLKNHLNEEDLKCVNQSCKNPCSLNIFKK